MDKLKRFLRRTAIVLLAALMLAPVGEQLVQANVSSAKVT